MGDGTLTVWTLGHGAIEVDELVELLAQFGIDTLVDVRSVPYSRFAPQFSRDILRAAVERAGRTYAYLGERLGGRPARPDLALPNGEPDYVAMAATPAFAAGLQEVLERAARERVCLLCSEEDPARCHRTLLVGEQLTAQGCAVLHIRHAGVTETHAEVVKRHTGGQLALF